MNSLNVLEIYKKYLSNHVSNKHEMELIKCSEKDIFLGVDKDGHVAIVCYSTVEGRTPIIQKTKLLLLECNINADLWVDGVKRNKTVHIIRCLTNSEKDKKIFLELCPLFIEENDEEDQQEGILDVFTTLLSFFSKSKECSDIELEGLYAELYTIALYHEKYRLEKYWHTKSSQKFDFSITDKVKIEVKATTKTSRVHHFKHDQIYSDAFEIYLFSYMLRADDQGVSLYDLIEGCKTFVSDDPARLMLLNYYKKNTSEARLKSIKYSEPYTQNMRKIYKAREIPKFTEKTPAGVSNAEYDCNLENADELDEKEFWEILSPML